METKEIEIGQTVKAKIKSSGNEVTVYRRGMGGFVNYADCKTVYQENELIF